MLFSRSGREGFLACVDLASPGGSLPKPKGSTLCQVRSAPQRPRQHIMETPHRRLQQHRKPHLIHRVWCSGNIVDSHCPAVTALSTAPGSTPGIRVTFCPRFPGVGHILLHGGSIHGRYKYSDEVVWREKGGPEKRDRGLGYCSLVLKQATGGPGSRPQSV